MPVTRNQSNAAANAKSNAVATDTSGPRENSERGETSTETEPSRRDSPENCSICLGPFNNKSFTSSCAHSFCFVCLKQWSKVKAECPLCKQAFTSIFHNIRSNDNYDIYELPPLNPPRQFDYNYFYNYMGGSLTTFASHPYLMPQPTLDADLTLSNFSRFQFRHRRYDRYNSLHPVHGEHQYSYSSSSFNPSTHVSAVTWPRGAEDFRLRVYRHHMGPPAVILGCENSTYRLTPAMVAASAHRMQRILPWLTRELLVLLRSHQNVRLVVSIIQPLLSQVTIDSEYFSERISPLIGQRARQFIQEFIAFTNSALNMQTFDRKAMYRRHTARFLEENTSSSSSDDDDVVEVTDVSPDLPASSVITMPTNASSNLQRAGWDSPTPGPSWETMDTQIANTQIESERVSISSESDDPGFRPGLNDSDSDNSKTGSDIVFVKFDKPWNERSPIKLSSDSEGERRSRKRKKIKHKKKRREVSDVHIESSKKTKGHKSSKSKSKEKVRTTKTNSEEECQASSTHNRAHSAVSSEKQKKKKHRRSKDRNDDTLGRDRDRELVDRLFVEALTQQQNVHTICESGDASLPSSSKSKEKNAGKSHDKERHRRKKKKKNQSRSSASPAMLPSYKKHHSGHKRSQDKNNHELERKKHRRLSRENAPEYSRTSLERELQASRNKSLPSASVDHPMTSTFQTSYLARTDTVQHIPLNLWVSTWPSLPVPHTFPAPPSSSFSASTLSQPLASGLPSHSLNHCLSEHNSSAMNSQTISSESESSSDSDTDDSPTKSVSPVLNRSRTKQWLDANFSSVGRHPSSTSIQQRSATIPSTTRIWGIENITETNNISSGPSDDVADIVSIASGDEDIVVCSSASSTKSDSDEVKVIESCDLPEATAPPPCVNYSVTTNAHKNALIDDASKHSIPSMEQGSITSTCSLSDQILSSPSYSSFQPFKLHKKSASAVQNVNPIFSSITQNSDDDGIGETETSAEPQTSEAGMTESANVLSNSIQHAMRSPSDLEFNTAVTSASTQENTAVLPVNTFPPPSSIFESSLKRSSDIPIPTSGGCHIHSRHSGEQNASSASFSIASSTSESVFGVLPPHHTPVTAPVPSILSSSLSYLPYPPLSMSTPLTSILPQPMPFLVPQAPAPPSLPLHFSFPPIPTLIPSTPTLFPTVYVSYSQTAQVATTGSSNTFLPGQDSKPSHLSLMTDSILTEGVENRKAECSPVADVDGNETSTSEMTSACPQNNFASIFTQDSKYENTVEPSTSEEASYLVTNNSDKRNFLSIHKQDMGDTKSCIKNIIDFLDEENNSNKFLSGACETVPIDERTVEQTVYPNEPPRTAASISENSLNPGCDAPEHVLEEDVCSPHTDVTNSHKEQNGTE